MDIRRTLFLSVAFTLLIGLITYRLYEIQLVDNKYLSNKGIAIRSIKLANDVALRGIISDRNFVEISGGGWIVKEKKNGQLPSFKRYGETPLAAHVVGHLNDKKQGVMGAEKWYDNFLQAPKKAAVYAEKDVKGHLIPGKGVFIYPPTNYLRKNVVLTVDKQIQKITEEVCDGVVDKNISLESGAVAVMNVKSGEILALVSRPNFDPKKPVAGSKNNLMNKAFEFYYPGSVFKILIAAAAYEKGLISEKEKFNCNGSYTISSTVISCSKIEGHGEQTFTEAFANSCNPAFISIGQKVYKQGINDYVKKFALDRQDIIGYPYITGKNINIGSGKIALANASIGQQGIKLSVVQVASIVSTIANNGKYNQPKLVREIRVLNGPTVKTFASPKPRQVISLATAKKIQALMAQVTETGTGTNAWVAGAGSAGKTGSAQTGMRNAAGKEIINAWFAGYVPLQRPQYAIVVLAEEGRFGGKAAAPVFREIAKKLTTWKRDNE